MARDAHISALLRGGKKIVVRLSQNKKGKHF